MFASHIIALSTGYFIHDTLDMAINRVYFDDVGVWVHHFMV